jgi:5-aminopentanamidase
VIVAVGQLHVGEGDVDTNAWRCRRALEDAAVAGAELLVLPECALTGYLFDDRDAAEVAAIRACDPRIRELGNLAVQAGMTVVVGFLERTGDTLANSAAVLGSDGGVTLVRKTHLPVLGADRFVAAGDRIGPVIELPFGKLGVAICYDVRFPEVCRALALAGAEVIAVPVNRSSHRRPDLYGSLSPDQES